MYPERFSIDQKIPLCVCVCVHTYVYIQVLSNKASPISQEDRPLLQKRNKRILHSYLWIFTHSRKNLKINRVHAICNKYPGYSNYNTRSNFSIIFKLLYWNSIFLFFFFFFFNYLDSSFRFFFAFFLARIFLKTVSIFYSRLSDYVSKFLFQAFKSHFPSIPLLVLNSFLSR